MDYTEEQLTQIEQYASIYLKISDMAVILGISATRLREDIVLTRARRYQGDTTVARRLHV